MSARVSFIIPHKGREELLVQTLQTIWRLDYDPAFIEVVVVTQNSVLDCPSIEQHRSQCRVVFRPEQETIAALRNVGVLHSTGEYLAFLDADIELSPNWLRAMFAELMAKSGRVMVSAVQQASAQRTSIERAKVALYRTLADRPVQFLGGANLFLPRSVFEQAGGFPSALRTCEDYYFTDRVCQQGEVYCTSEASFVHLGEDPNFRTMLRKEVWRGQSNFLSLRGRQLSLRELPSVLTPIWQAGFAMVTLLGVLLSNVFVVFAGLLLMILPTVLYARRIYALSQRELQVGEAFWFYTVYHTARVIGTVSGLFRALPFGRRNPV